MAEITAKMVMELREKTGAAMMLCKEALKETNADFEEATVWIRKKMGGKAAGATDRVAGEGIVAIVVADSRDAAIVELNSETDFVARSEDFKALAKELAEHVLTNKSENVDHALTQPSQIQEGFLLQDRVNDVYSKLREKMVFKRFDVMQSDENGVVAGYVHVPANDKIGVLVELGAKTPEDAKSEGMQNLARALAMQIAATKPKYQSREEVSEKTLAQERDIARSTALSEGKPEAAVEKIVEGRVRKFYEEAVLLDQAWLREQKKSVSQVLTEHGATLRRFVRYNVGEEVKGVETSGGIKESAE